MKTLLLNPPSFPNFDGGAGSRWPAAREIASFWYPVWLSYPAGLIKDSRLLDAPPQRLNAKDTPVPYHPNLWAAHRPTARSIAVAARNLLRL